MDKQFIETAKKVAKLILDKNKKRNREIKGLDKLWINNKTDKS